MDRQYIRDNQVIERYLAGALTAEEEQVFEETYLGDSEILDQIEAAERLRDGIKELDTGGHLKRLRPPPAWRRMLASPRYAAAASLLFAVSLGFSTVLYRENRDLRADDFSSISAITRLVPLDAVRGGDTAPIREPTADEWIELVLDAGTVAYDTYRATLTRGDGERSELIWTRADLVPEPDKTIRIGVPGRRLRPSSYEVRLEGRLDDWPADSFEEIAVQRLTIVPRD